MTARSLSPSTFATLACLAVAALALLGDAAAAVDAGAKIRFGAMPKRVVQGKDAAVAIAVARGARCSLTFRYGDGNLQSGLRPIRATTGRARWTWQVPETAATGPAKVIVDCGRAGRIVGSLPVIAGPKPTGVVVTDSGFSQKIEDNRARVSWGVVLTNQSPDRDALEVTVLVNFVDATNTVLATDSENVDGIRAGSPFYLGGGMSVPTTPIARLEFVVTIGSRAPRVVHEPPLEDVRLIPGRGAYLGAVVGQVTNDRSGLVLTRATVSAVLYDAAGKITGGTSGVVYAALPWQKRSFWSAALHADPIPLTRAAGAKVSAEPIWEVEGS